MRETELRNLEELNELRGLVKERDTNLREDGNRLAMLKGELAAAA